MSTSIVDQCVEETTHNVGLCIIVPFLVIMVGVHLLKLRFCVCPSTVLKSFYWCLFLASLVFVINVYHCSHVSSSVYDPNPTLEETPPDNQDDDELFAGHLGRHLQQYSYYLGEGSLDGSTENDSFSNNVPCGGYSVQVFAALDGSVDCCLRYIVPVENCTDIELDFFGRDQPLGTQVNATVTLTNGTALMFTGNPPAGGLNTWIISTINTLEWGLGIGDQVNVRFFFTYTNGTVNQVDKGYFFNDGVCPSPSPTPSNTPSISQSASATITEDKNILGFQVIFSILFLVGGYLLGVCVLMQVCEKKSLSPCKTEVCCTTHKKRLY